MASNISQLLQLKISVDGAAKAKTEVSSLGSTVANLGKQLVGPIAGFLSLAKAIQLTGEAMHKAGIQQLAEKKVANAIEATGHSAKLTAEDLKKTALELQNLSNVGDEEILSGLTATLLTFREIQGDVFKRAQKDILDMSQFLGSDLQSASIQVGKALNEPIKGMIALRRVGVSFTQSQIDMVTALVNTNNLAAAQDIILTELEHEFGNAAAAAITSGKQLKNAWGDFLEAIGKSANKITSPMKIALTEMLKIWTEEIDGITKSDDEAAIHMKKSWSSAYIGIMVSINAIFDLIGNSGQLLMNLAQGVMSYIGDLVDYVQKSISTTFRGILSTANEFAKQFSLVIFGQTSISGAIDSFNAQVSKAFDFKSMKNVVSKGTKEFFGQYNSILDGIFSRAENNYDKAYWNAKKKIDLMAKLKTGAPLAPTDNTDAAGNAADQIDIISAQLDMIKSLGADYQAFYDLRKQQIKTERDAYIAANIDKNLVDTWYISQLGNLSKEWESFDINKKNAESAKKAADEVNASIEAQKKAYDDQISAFKANRDKISEFLLENGTSYQEYVSLRKQQLNDEYNDYLNAGASIADAELWKQQKIMQIEKDWQDKRVTQYKGFNKLFADALTSINQSLELSLQNSFYSIISSTDSFTDAMKNLWSSLKVAILQEISAIIAKMLLLKTAQLLFANSNPITAIIGGVGSLFGGGKTTLGGLGGTDLVGSQTASVGKSNSFMNQIGNAQIFDSLQNSINRLSKAIENQQQPQINVYPVGGVKLYDVVRKAQLQANAL